MKRKPIEEIKDAISCHFYAQSVLGLPIRSAGDRCVSFRPGAKNPTSLVVNERFWYDFGAGHGGDVIDLCAQAHHEGQLLPAIRELLSLAGLDVSPVNLPHGRHFAQFPEQAAAYHTNLTPEHRTYCHERGITDATIDTLLIGSAHEGQHAGRLVIPYWKAGRPAYLISRGDAPKYKKNSLTAYSSHPIWGTDTLSRSDPVIIPEGAFDALSVYQEGYAVLSPMAGAFSSAQRNDLFALLKNRFAIICMDYDPQSQTGQTATNVLAELLFLQGIRTHIVMLKGDSEKVDISSLYAQGESIPDILSDHKPYAQHYCDLLAALDPEEAKQRLRAFLAKTSRVFEWPEVAEIVSYAVSLKAWNTIWLRELASTLRKAPSDDAIVAELAKQHQLIYNEQLGWYEYDSQRGVWLLRYETQIEGLIAGLLQRYRTGPRIRSALVVAQSHFCNHTPLNEHHLINFGNGMLDTDTMELRPHSPEYYSSIQLAYAFQPECECPLWINFVNTITNGDEDRARIIQQLFGYALTSDRRYQKAFFLIGDGSNGKSVLLNIMAALMGEENVAHVEVSSLNEPFQRIALHGRLLNIACETKSNVRGTETTFKQCVTGDPISGCYKGKDFITFRPFALMVFASNEFSETDDLTHGFLRRLQFIQFPVRFVDNPTAPNHRKKDRTIESRLRKELAGIANWAVAGLHDLRESDCFWETPDHHSMMRDFIMMSSPLLLFLEDDPTCLDDWAERRFVYKRYSDWAKENNCRPISVRKFWVCLRTHASISEMKSGGSRYVRRSQTLIQDLAE